MTRESTCCHHNIIIHNRIHQHLEWRMWKKGTGNWKGSLIENVMTIVKSVKNRKSVWWIGKRPFSFRFCNNVDEGREERQQRKITLEQHHSLPSLVSREIFTRKFSLQWFTPSGRNATREQILRRWNFLAFILRLSTTHLSEWKTLDHRGRKPCHAAVQHHWKQEKKSQKQKGEKAFQWSDELIKRKY